MVDDALATIAGPVRKLLAYAETSPVEVLIELLAEPLSARLEATHSGLDFVEIGPGGVSKASALALLIDRFSIDHRQTIVFGDARNDHEMLRWASTGVAMGNADDETRALADTIARSNDDDGVAHYVEDLLGGR